MKAIVDRALLQNAWSTMKLAELYTCGNNACLYVRARNDGYALKPRSWRSGATTFPRPFSQEAHWTPAAMDHNPFRSYNNNPLSNASSGQPVYSQSADMPPQNAGNFNSAGFGTSTTYQQQQQQQQPLYGQPQSYQQQPYQLQQPSYQQQPLQQQPLFPQPTGFMNQPITMATTTAATPGFSQQHYPYFSQPQQQPMNMSTGPFPMSGYPTTTTTINYSQQPFTSMPFHHHQQQRQHMYGAGLYNPSTVYIPPDFGLSSQPQQQQQTTRKHPPVDASTLLKSGRVRKVECPVCHKTIEGDDPAINYHVNEHLEYDTWLNHFFLPPPPWLREHFRFSSLPSFCVFPHSFVQCALANSCKSKMARQHN